MGRPIEETSTENVNLKRVQLASKTDGLVQFFQIKLPDIAKLYRQDPAPAEQLRSWNEIEYLEIYFESTLCPTVTSPWSSVPLSSLRGEHPEIDECIYPCRRIFVD